MIEINVPIPLDGYRQVRDDLEQQFNEHAIPVFMSADTVIRTWAGLAFFDWFHQQDGQDVENHLGWGEIQVPWQDEAMLAAVDHNFVDDGMVPMIVMMFHDEEVEFDDDGYAKRQRDLALLFKLAHGGA